MPNRNTERSKEEKDKNIVDVDESILSRVSSLRREREKETFLFLSFPYPSNLLCIVHIWRQRQAVAGRKQRVHEAPQKDGRRWTGNKMKSTTEFGAQAESYSRTRRGSNSNNVFLALLVFSAFSAFPPAVALPAFSKKKKEKVREKESSTYLPFMTGSNISLRSDSSARIEMAQDAALNSD